MTWPPSTADREMFIVRKRAMIPSVMSCETETAGPVAPPATESSSTPGTTYWRYDAVSPAGRPAPGRPAPSVPPST